MPIVVFLQAHCFFSSSSASLLILLLFSSISFLFLRCNLAVYHPLASSSSSSAQSLPSIVLFISLSPALPPLPLGELLQTCLFGATTHLGPCCRSHQVIGAEARTSTENTGQGGRKYLCVCVCLSVGARRAERREKREKTEGRSKEETEEKQKKRRTLTTHVLEHVKAATAHHRDFHMLVSCYRRQRANNQSSNFYNTHTPRLVTFKKFKINTSMQIFTINYCDILA